MSNILYNPIDEKLIPSIHPLFTFLSGGSEHLNMFIIPFSSPNPIDENQHH